VIGEGAAVRLGVSVCVVFFLGGSLLLVFASFFFFCCVGGEGGGGGVFLCCFFWCCGGVWGVGGFFFVLFDCLFLCFWLCGGVHSDLDGPEAASRSAHHRESLTFFWGHSGSPFLYLLARACSGVHFFRVLCLRAFLLAL